MKLLQIDNSTNHDITVWFWRKKRNNGTQYHSRCIRLAWLRKIWKNNGVSPMYKITDNGATKRNKDSCFDMSVYIGYFIFGYTNWSLS